MPKLIAEEKKENTIEYDEGDAILIYKANGDVKLVLPDTGESEEEVPDHILVMSAVAAKLSNDVTFHAEMVTWFEDYVDFLNGQEKLVINRDDSRMWN